MGPIDVDGGRKHDGGAPPPRHTAAGRRRRRGRVPRPLAVALATALLLSAPGGALADTTGPTPHCVTTPSDSVTDGANQETMDAAAAHADILEVCVTFTTTELVLEVAVREPTDPGADPSWTLAGETVLEFSLATEAEMAFPDEGIVLGTEAYAVEVIPQPTGGWRALLSDADYRCDGLPELLPERGYRVTFDLDDTACLDADTTRLAVRPLMVYDTAPGDPAPETLRVDAHPGQDGHFGWVEQVAAPTTAFPDVDPDSVHADNIARLAELGITTGDTDGNFNPAGTVTRAQFATFLARAFELDAVDGDHFTDVDPDSVHAGNIYAVADAGITQGTTPTTFDPHGTLPRDQMASLLARAFELDAVDGDHFTDVDPDSVHAGNIYAVADAGITQGTTPTTFDPHGTLRRDQMASLLIRGLETRED